MLKPTHFYLGSFFLIGILFALVQPCPSAMASEENKCAALPSGVFYTVSQDLFKCAICNKLFDRQIDVQKHLKREHPHTTAPQIPQTHPLTLQWLQEQLNMGPKDQDYEGTNKKTQSTKRSTVRSKSQPKKKRKSASVTKEVQQVSAEEQNKYKANSFDSNMGSPFSEPQSPLTDSGHSVPSNECPPSFQFAPINESLKDLNDIRIKQEIDIESNHDIVDVFKGYTKSDRIELD